LGASAHGFGSAWSTVLVDLLHDGVELGFKLLLLCLIFGGLSVWVALEEL